MVADSLNRTTPGSATSDFSGLWPTTFLTNPLTSNPNEASRPNQPIFTNQPTYSVEALYEMLEAAESGGALGPLLRAIVRSIEELRENPQAQARGRIGL